MGRGVRRRRAADIFGADRDRRAGLVAVLAAIVVAVIMVGETSMMNAVPRRVPAVMPTATTAFVPPATSAPATPAGDTAFFGQLPHVPTVGQVLAP